MKAIAPPATLSTGRSVTVVLGLVSRLELAPNVFGNVAYLGRRSASEML